MAGDSLFDLRKQLVTGPCIDVYHRVRGECARCDVDRQPATIDEYLLGRVVHDFDDDAASCGNFVAGRDRYSRRIADGLAVSVTFGVLTGDGLGAGGGAAAGVALAVGGVFKVSEESHEEQQTCYGHDGCANGDVCSRHEDKDECPDDGCDEHDAQKARVVQDFHVTTPCRS